jgi:putative redox protein
MRFVAQVRGHRIETDQPAYGTGDDSAAMPLELIGAALATCIALYAHQYLVTRALPADGLRVELTSEMASHPKRIGRFDVVLVLPPDLPEEHRERLERVAVSCPAHATLTHAPEIVVRVEQPALG